MTNVGFLTPWTCEKLEVLVWVIPKQGDGRDEEKLPGLGRL